MHIRIKFLLRRVVLLPGILLVSLLFGFGAATGDIALVNVVPSTATLQVGSQQFFMAIGDDGNGNPIILLDPQWSITPDNGGVGITPIADTCIAAAMQPGNYTLTCKEGGTSIEGHAQITVTAAELASIELQPSNVTLNVGEQQIFNAIGKDASGNQTPITNPVWTTSGGGTLTPNGSQCTYTPTTAGNYTITCTEQGTTIEGTANIQVNDSQVLTSIELQPSNVTLNVGEQQIFNAIGKDQNGQDMPLTNPQWTTSGGGTIVPNGSQCTYTATTAGNYTITCTEQGTTVEGTANIEAIEPQVLTSIEIQPDNVSLNVGDQQIFNAIGKDQNGQDMPLTNPQWTTSGGGTIVPNGSQCTYTATTAGNYTITCMEQGTTIEGTANIEAIEPQVLTSIEIQPDNVSLNVGDQQIFNAIGKDQNGQDMPLTNPQWTTSGGGTIVPNGSQCTYTATTAGDYTISCEEKGTGDPPLGPLGPLGFLGVIGTANIHVIEPPQLTSIDIEPANVTLNVGEQQLFNAIGKDQNGDPMAIPDPQWSISGGGTIAPNGSQCTYTATEAGDFTVKVSVSRSSIIGIARVHVGPDDDEDSTRNSVEDNAPNNGDGNGDGIPDSQQANITSLPSATGQGYITVETTCTENQNVWAYTEKEASLGADFDYDYNYAYGLVGFSLPCSSATVRIYFHDTNDLTGYIYRKYGPIPPDFDIPQWYTLPDVTFGTETVGEQVVAYVEFTLTDGELGDDTGVDGQIVEPGGPAFVASDFNRDFVVDFADLRFLTEQWLYGPESDADLDGSGQVNNVDLALFSRNWRR